MGFNTDSRLGMAHTTPTQAGTVDPVDLKRLLVDESHPPPLADQN